MSIGFSSTPVSSPAPACSGVSGAVAADVFAGVVKRTVRPQKCKNSGLVLCRKGLIEASTLHGFHQQLAYVPAGVVHHAALHDGCSTIGRIVSVSSWIEMS